MFTDGACRGNPGPGGWGAILRFAAAAGVPSPDEAALQLHMLIDGATAAAVVDRQPGAAAGARAMAATVLTARQPVPA